MLLPPRGIHARARDRLRDALVWNLTGAIRDQHPSVQDIEGKAVLTSHHRPDRLLENSDLLSAVHPAHMENAPAPKRGLGRAGSIGYALLRARRATGVFNDTGLAPLIVGCVVISRVIVSGMVVLRMIIRHRAIARSEGIFTLALR